MPTTFVRRTSLREALLAFTLGATGTLLQLACGGKGDSAPPPPPPTPVISSFTAAKTPITVGTSTTLTGVFTNGTGAVDKGVGAVTTGTPATVSPTVDTTYTLTVTNSAGVAVTSAASVAVVAAPTTPVITAPTAVTAGQAGYAASVPAQTGSTYAWTITNGTITAGATTTGITFTAGATGPVGLSCIVTNAAGTASTAGTANATVVAAPTTPVITAPTAVTAGQAGYTASVPAQTGSTYAWTITNGTITAGGTTTSITFTAGATGSVGLSCVVSNSLGSPSAAGLASSAIAAAPTTPVVTAPAYVTASQAGYTASVPAQAGSTYAWTLTNGTITAGATSTSITFTAGATGPVGFSCVVTNAAGTASTPGTGSSTVVAAPATPTVTAPANVTAGQAGYTASIAAQAGSTYAWTLTNGTVTAGAGTPSITFTPGASGNVGFSCVVSNAAGTASTPGTASSAIAAAPVTPVITAPAAVTASQAGYTASIPAQAGSTYAWTLTNGTVTAGAGTTSITFTPAASGSVGFSCVVTNVAGTASTPGTASSAIVALPTTPVLTVPANITAGQTASASSVPLQAGSTYAWTLTNGTVASGAGTNSITFTAGASGSVGFSCVVTNAGGTPSSAGTASTTIVPAPVIPVITKPDYVTAGEGPYNASIVAQSGMTSAWTITNGTFTSGTTGTAVTFSAGGTGAVYLNCKVTNAAGTNVTGSGSSTIVPLPFISQLSASVADVVSGGASTLSYAFSGGAGSINRSIGAVTSGGATVVHPTSTTTYTLTVTNLAGDSVQDNVTITVGLTASISSFDATASTITAGQGTQLTFNFVGTGVITPGNIPVTTGGELPVFPASTTIYTLTATNNAGTSVTATTTVTVKAYTGKFVYVANTGGGVSGFSLNETTGALTEVSNSPFDDGTKALHVTSDPAGKFLFVVNGDGLADDPKTLTVFQINQTTGELTGEVAYTVGTKAWASTVDPSGQYVYVRCSGVIKAFSLNGATGVLTPLADTVTAAGTGEVLVHPSGKYLFTVGRDSDQLQGFTLNAGTGALSPNGSTNLPTGTGPLSLALSHSGEYLFTKGEGAPGGDPLDCVLYGYYVDPQNGGLTPLAGTSTGIQQADSYHGVSANPTQSVIYITLATTANDYAAYALNLVTGELSALSGTTYDLFGGTGSDSLTVSRNGKWGFLTDYQGGRIAVAAVDPATGVLNNPTFTNVGLFPVSVTVVGTVQ